MARFMTASHDPLSQAKARFAQEAAKQAEMAYDRDLEEFLRIYKAHPEFRALLGDHFSADPAQPQDTTGETVASLTRSYREHPDSTYHTISFATRENYSSLLKRLDNDIGSVLLTALDTEFIRNQYETWATHGLTQAHSLITIMRIAATHGAKILNSRACRELKLTLHEMHFPQPKARTVRLTEKHVNDIRAVARDMRLPSIALAQAFQWDAGLNQKMVIGEWVPDEEPGESKVRFILSRNGTSRKLKWVRGLRWDSIGDDMILRHKNSYTDKPIEVDVRNLPMVSEEMDRIKGGIPRTDAPIIVFENTRRPYLTHQFRRTWREVAKIAGVPPDVTNRDSRPEQEAQ
jgi:hypothetical protein